MRPSLALALASVALASLAAAAPVRPSATINSQSPGPTPFIAGLDITIAPPDGLKAVSFTIEPKPFSVTRPVHASFTSAYLIRRGFLNPSTGHLALPVFGLYQGRENIVDVAFDFASGPSDTQFVSITTSPWADPLGGAYLSPAVVQPRLSTTDLSYDFYMLKGFAAGISPLLVDTDGEVRWVGTSGLASISAIFWENGIYISNGTGILRMELDGAFANVADYSGIGVTFTGHHNYDRGKRGFLVEVNEVDSVESTVLEVDGAGRVLKTWKVADIIRAAMTAGGDDPSGFVNPPNDWFHMNAATYDRHQDALVISGREDFVIALDYETGAIKWIFGDETKAWGQYPSLLKYSLSPLGFTRPPIGQHAVSITWDRGLLLFDNGRASLNHSPIGQDRNQSTPRKYVINARKMTAQEVSLGVLPPTNLSQYCSSVYEDERGNYLMDYSLAGDVIGYDATGAKVFHYDYAPDCALSWNAAPMHLENLRFE